MADSRAAENKFLYDVIASQNSMQRKCQRLISFLHSHYEDHLLNSFEHKHFFIEVTDPVCGEFNIWIYDGNKAPTYFGIKCVAIFLAVEISLVKDKSDSTGRGTTPYQTLGDCNLFPKGDSKEINDHEEIIPYINELANLVVGCKNLKSVLAPMDKK